MLDGAKSILEHLQQVRIYAKSWLVERRANVGCYKLTRS